LIPSLIRAGVDVLIGVDPVQGKGMDLARVKELARGKLCLWGGVNGFITIGRGSADDVTREVDTAFDVLAPSGGFILSPVDNVRDDDDRARGNVSAMIRAWRRRIEAR